MTVYYLDLGSLRKRVRVLRSPIEKFYIYLPYNDIILSRNTQTSIDIFIYKMYSGLMLAV